MTSRSLRVQEPDLAWIRIDHQTRLEFADAEIVIECPFELEVDGRRHHLDPNDRGGLGPLLAVYPDRLVSGTADDDGTLRLKFEGGASIVVPAHPDYEAWGVSQDDGLRLVCMPGGDRILVPREVGAFPSDQTQTPDGRDCGPLAELIVLSDSHPGRT